MLKSDVVDLRVYRDEPATSDELRVGTSLMQGQYTITGFLNSGGFALTYRATDSLGRPLVIKECFPMALCYRSGNAVCVRNAGERGTLDAIISDFVTEAHSLAALTHPSVVHVHQVFEENGSAYMAMDLIEGRDLEETLERTPERLSPARIEDIARRGLAAIGYVHDRGMLHRDLSPCNVMLRDDGAPILIDFGAARRDAQAQAGSKMTAVKDGYSPPELYRRDGAQGTWSDVYAFGATLAHLVMRSMPPAADVRVAAIKAGEGDPLAPLAGRFDGYSEGFLASVDRALAVEADARFQSVAEWQEVLGWGESAAAPTSRVRSGPVSMAAERAADWAADIARTRGWRPGPMALAAGVTAALAVSALLLSGGTGRERSPITVSAQGAALSPIAAESRPARVRARLDRKVMSHAPLRPGRPRAEALPRVIGNSPVGVTSIAALSEPVSEPGARLRLDWPDAGFAPPRPAQSVSRAGADGLPAIGRAPDGPPAGNAIVARQTTVALPFTETIARRRNANVIEIGAVRPGTQNPWLADGAVIYSFNNTPLRPGLSLRGHFGAPEADPDGMARATVRYRDPATGTIRRGLLTVAVVEEVTLADGTELRARRGEDGWTFDVVTAGGGSGLREGQTLRAPAGASLEAAIRDLAALGRMPPTP